MNPRAIKAAPSESTIDFSSGRGDIIANAISILQSDISNKNYVNIVFGHGPFSYQRLIQGPYSSWESDYLHSLMEQGIIGLILVILIYSYLIRYIYKGLRSDDYLVNALATAGIITFVMSFFTLRITGWHSAGVFIIIYHFLVRGLADEEKA
jgi:O-antigen ligase